MAGEWIKVRTNLWDDPRVGQLCELTDQGEAAVIGGLYWLWATADEHSSDGLLAGMTTRTIDRKTGVAGLGCVACAKDGVENAWVSIHHIDGRTKPGAHLLVLPLCAGHHQAGTGTDPSLIAVHPDKARFEQRYGSQYELLAEAKRKLGLEEDVAC